MKKQSIAKRKSMHDSFNGLEHGYWGVSNMTCPVVGLEVGNINLASAGDVRTIIHDMSEGSVTG